MKKIFLSCTIGLSLLVSSCNENNTVVNNDSNPPQENSGNPTSETTPDNSSENESSTKTNEELILEGAKLALNTTMDVIEKQRIKDSINDANREKMYAYQIGLKYHEQDAFDTYNKLTSLGISNIYIFKIARKEYCVVKFEAKNKEDLDNNKNEFVNSLGDNGTEGVSIINLMDYCSRKETIIKQVKTENGVELKCLVCD